MLDWRTAIQRPGVFDTISRGSLTAWPPGGVSLIGDSLGPQMHAHDDASEIFYFMSGDCRLEVGRTEHLLVAGDFVLVPPEAPHNLWNATPDEPLVVFWLVAPNYVDNKWRTDDFRPEGYERPLQRARADASVSLPSDGNIVSEFLEIAANATHRAEAAADEDTVILVTAGGATIRRGNDAETLERGGWLHLPSGLAWTVEPAGHAASVLVMRVPHRRPSA